MGGKKDKKKKANKDPLKKAALAAKKEAKADKAALKRIQKEQDRINAISLNDDDVNNDGKRSKKGSKQSSSARENDIDSILNEYRSQTKELLASEVEVIDSFPNPPRGNFTWTLCPTNGMFYMVSTKVVFCVNNMMCISYAHALLCFMHCNFSL